MVPVTELLVIERREGTTSEVGLVVRVHAGCLNLGDRLSAALDAAGERYDIAVTCQEIRLYENVLLDHLDENYGGYVVLRGEGANSIDQDWTLMTE